MNGVSIVICCYNASSRIAPTLEHIQKQKFSASIPWEVIVIDNASTDNTSEIAVSTWKRNPVTDFRICREEQAGLNFARSRGFEEAKYSIISLVDDDNWVENQWVEKVYTLFQEHPTVGGCAGQNIPVFDTDPPAWFPLFKHSYASGTLHFNEGIVNPDTPGNLWGAGLSIRKKVIEELKKIHFKFITTDRKGKSLACGGDTELCYAIRLLGYDLYYTNDLVLKHFIPKQRLTWQYLEGVNYEMGKLQVKVGAYFFHYHKRDQKPWFIHLRNAAFMHYKYYLQSFFASNKESKWRYRIKATLWKGRMAEHFADKGVVSKKNYEFIQGIFKPAFKKLSFAKEELLD